MQVSARSVRIKYSNEKGDIMDRMTKAIIISWLIVATTFLVGFLAILSKLL